MNAAQTVNASFRKMAEKAVKEAQATLLAAIAANDGNTECEAVRVAVRRVMSRKAMLADC